MEKVLKAVHFAAAKHSTQRRKNKTADPYINHPIEVAYFLSQVPGVNEETIIAGLLHDTVEDTNTRREEIEQEFGSEIANIVMECTDDKSLPKVTRKRLQIIHASSSMSREARLVKLADKLSNLKNLLTDPPISWSPEVVRGYVMWSYAVISNLRQAPLFDISFLTNQLDDIFRSFNIDVLNSEVLENYYNLIAE